MPLQQKKKRDFKKNPILYLKILLFFLFFLSLPGIPVYQSPMMYSSALDLEQIPSPAPFPQNLNKSPFPKISAEGVIIIDLPSQVVLYEKNSQTRFPPASTTKIITSLVALDYYRLEEVLEVKKVITEGRTMGLVAGEKISVENLILGALIHSANDAAYVLAEGYPGGVPAFVVKMNEKVVSLGLTNTHFTNPVGFEDENQYTTAYDLAQICRIALENSLIKKITGTKLISVSDESYTLFHTLENVNLLLGKVPGVAGVKTGWTQQAGEVLSTVVKREKHEILIVLLKSDNRFGETEALINWVFDNFEWVDLQPTKIQSLVNHSLLTAFA